MLWLKIKQYRDCIHVDQRSLLKDFESFVLYTRVSWLASAQAATAYLSKLDSLYPTLSISSMAVEVPDNYFEV